ncbi:aminotransferase class I/II-fold pyridoxal phosphate-dependent enzyme [Geminicoccus harenae]|uniref:aminotransferase class I/II-fold pyridoxal phosphate-dependent enzyme n=2 Tax=Geminicoccus harenae TaxID=2498453 RepID=UPI001C964750|nr:aminotransferase class I/II-fold pyridoxal phosphate-dependent enzyme [Geminicoccus harenae]
MHGSRLDRLGEFPFRRLAGLLADRVPPAGRPVLDLGIGEPQHPVPPILAETVARHAASWNRYPPPTGTPSFRQAVAGWACRRGGLPEGALDPGRHVLPVAGTKEALYLAAQLAVDRAGRSRPAVLMPTPFYAVYYGAAAMAGAEPVLLPATVATGFLPDLDAIPAETLARTAAFYLCTPANPQGAVADRAYLARALALARQHGFALFLDECYSELWDRTPPPSGLDVALNDTGSLERLLVFQSLSKRSNAAGLRSGFVAGDPALIRAFAKLRAYAAPVQPLPLMAAAEALWNDEAHVEANRALYRQKFDLAEQRLAGRFGFFRPPAGFFLWLDVGDGVAAASRLWTEAGLKVLPGAYLDGPEPISGAYLRLALVHGLDTTADALDRLVATLASPAATARPDRAALAKGR